MRFASGISFFLVLTLVNFQISPTLSQCVNRMCRPRPCNGGEWNSGNCKNGDNECCDRQCDLADATQTCGTAAGCFVRTVREIATPSGRRTANCAREVIMTAMACQDAATCMDCVATYSDWSACSASCGSGVETRSRVVSAPAVGLGRCDLPVSDARQCSLGPCATTTVVGPATLPPPAADTITLPPAKVLVVAAEPLAPLLASLGGTQSFQLANELGSLVADFHGTELPPETTALLTASGSTGAIGVGLGSSVAGEIRAPFLLRFSLAQRRRVTRLRLVGFDAAADTVSLVGFDFLKRGMASLALTQADTNFTDAGGFPTWELVVNNGSVGFAALELLDEIIPEPLPTSSAPTEATLSLALDGANDTASPIEASSSAPVSVVVIALCAAAGAVLLLAIVSVLVFVWRKHRDESGPDLVLGPNPLYSSSQFINQNPNMMSAVMDPFDASDAQTQENNHHFGGAVEYDARFDAEPMPVFYDAGFVAPTAPRPLGRTTEYTDFQ